MNTILEPLRALVRRKLWPVALVLVAALVAVPVLLAKQPEATAVAPVTPAASKTDDSIATAFVSAADDSANDDTGDESTTTKRRRTLGEKKDPFEPAPLPKAKKSSKKKSSKTQTTTTDTSTKSDSKSSDTGTSTGGGGAATPAPAPAATPTPTKTYPAGSIHIRFGTTDSDTLPVKLLKRDAALPDDDNPAFVFDRLSNDGESSIFNLTGTVTVEGDGKCLPTPENCQTLKLKEGETEFLTVATTDANGADTQTQYELDVLHMYEKATTVAVKSDQ